MMNKIKVIEPQIVVRGTVDKPYYEICYYEIAKKEWCIGYSSYDLKNVVGWLNECFEVIEADVVPVVHGHWTEKRFPGGGFWDYSFVCSHCHHETPVRGYSIAPDYCPNCGAKMDGGEENA